MIEASSATTQLTYIEKYVIKSTSQMVYLEGLCKSPEAHQALSQMWVNITINSLNGVNFPTNDWAVVLNENLLDIAKARANVFNEIGLTHKDAELTEDQSSQVSTLLNGAGSESFDRLPRIMQSLSLLSENANSPDAEIAEMIEKFSLQNSIELVYRVITERVIDGSEIEGVTTDLINKCNNSPTEVRQMLKNMYNGGQLYASTVVDETNLSNDYEFNFGQGTDAARAWICAELSHFIWANDQVHKTWYDKIQGKLRLNKESLPARLDPFDKDPDYNDLRTVIISTYRSVGGSLGEKLLMAAHKLYLDLHQLKKPAQEFKQALAAA